LAMLDTNGDGIVDDHELLGGAMAVFDPDGDGVSGNHSPEFATKDERAKVEESKGRQSTKKKKPSEKKSSAKKKKPSVKKAKAKEAEEKKFYKSAFASKQVWTSCSWYMEQFTTDDCRKLLAKSSKGAFVARRPPAAKDEKLSKADVCFSITSGDAAKPVYHVLIKNRVDTSDKKTWYLWDKDHWFEDLQDLVAYAGKHPFSFPTGTKDLHLDVKAAAKAVEMAKKKAKKAYKKMTPQQRQVHDMNAQVSRLNAGGK